MPVRVMLYSIQSPTLTPTAGGLAAGVVDADTIIIEGEAKRQMRTRDRRAFMFGQ